MTQIKNLENERIQKGIPNKKNIDSEVKKWFIKITVL